MGRVFVLGLLIAMIFAVLGRGFVSSSGGASNHGRFEKMGAGMVELPEARERTSLDRKSNGAEPVVSTGGPSFEGGGEAYLKEVGTFGREYVEVIGDTGVLMHVLVRQSHGVDRMTKPEAERLAGLLSKMEDAPEAGVVASYPKGYEDCARHVKAEAYSLRFAADAIREFSKSADAENLDEYSDLIGMHLQAVSSAKSCIADHLYPRLRQ